MRYQKILTFGIIFLLISSGIGLFFVSAEDVEDADDEGETEEGRDREEIPEERSSEERPHHRKERLEHHRRYERREGSRRFRENHYRSLGSGYRDSKPDVEIDVPWDRYTNHTPIRIDNNAELAAEASSGNGTEADPYVIEGWAIDGGGYGYCIYIGNTTDHFVVRDCYLHNASGNFDWPYSMNSGLNLYNVKNGWLDNNTASSNNNYGIHIHESYSNTVSNNTAPNNIDGIYLRSSSRNTLSNNTASSNGDGIELNSASTNNTLSNNNLSNNDGGIRLDTSSSNNTMNNNIASSNNNFGISILSSRYNTVTNNTASSNYYYGIYLLYSDGTTVSYNTVSSNINDGIYLDSSSSSTIYHNNFIDNGNQASDYGENWWNASYPTGGNYWSNYDGYDNYSGPNQSQSGSDGIGDKNQSISGSNVDEYPLMKPTRTAIEFNQGWNFVSFPCQDTPISIEDLLSSIAWDKSMVYSKGQWKTYRPSRSSHYNSVFPLINNTYGVWVHATEYGALHRVAKDVGKTNITLQPGWNMVGYPSAVDKLANDTLPDEISKIGVFSGSQKYNIDYINDLTTYTMIAGEGYWVYNSADYPVEWTVEY